MNLFFINSLTCFILVADMTETGQVVPKKPKKAEWFDEDSEKTTKVYVTGLPDGKAENWDEEEFTKYMSKCGVVDIDVRTNKPKVKLYKDDDGNYKGMCWGFRQGMGRRGRVHLKVGTRKSSLNTCQRSEM